MADSLEFGGSFSAGSAERAAGAAGVSKALRSTEAMVFIDVGAKKIDANVSRNGVPIGIHTIDPDVFDDIIVDRPILALRVVSQNVRAGTPVPLGTAIDLVMAPPGDLPVGVIIGTHVGLKRRKISEAFQAFVAGKPEINRIVTHAAAGQLTGEDEAAVRAIFAANDLAVTDEPGQDVNSAVEALRVLTTFGR